MSSLNWSNLRPWSGSQHSAFEELCCQLAAAEPAPKGADFRRVGAPDAGVECIWRAPNGGVRAWQAKFFTHPPTTSEWQQIDESVKQAVDHYLDLAAYTVCLPIDRPDARVPGKTSMMDRWDARVTKWTADAAAIGRDVAFYYWGEHEIVERLGRRKHAGRQHFWFNSETLGPNWFRERFDIARANAGPRYTPELNVELAISAVFDGLARHPRFFHRIQRQWGVARREVSRAIPTQRQVGGPAADTAMKAAELAVQSAADITRLAMETLGPAIAKLDTRPPELLPLDSLRAAVDQLLEALRTLGNRMDEADAVSAKSSTHESAASDTTRTRAGTSALSAPDRSYNNERHHLWNARHELENLDELLDDDAAQLANAPALLVTGEAGTGKTHLLCDVADRAVHADEPCVLILGEQFVRGDPWPQLMHQLHLGFQTPTEFLGALSAAGEAAGRRALLLIDALNEGEGRQLWPPRLAGFLATVAKYPWIGVALSVRSSYDTVVVPDAARARLREVEHHGFAEREIAATRRFFDAHGIERPSVPLLTPEFSNPLFLKLFCRGLKNRGLTRVPLGLEGISAVFAFFLDSVQDRLADPERLDFDQRLRVVEDAVSALASEMIQHGAAWVPRDQARIVTEGILPSRGGYERSLLRQLISEGVLSEELVWVGPNDERVDVVRFTYERLADHRMARMLLDAHSVSATSSAAQQDSSGSSNRAAAPLTIGGLWAKPNMVRYHRGVIEALAIQVPELTGNELWELWPEAPQSPLVMEAFFTSLEWRRPDAIGATARSIVDREIRARTDTGSRVRDLVVAVTARPGHPLDADYLNGVLAPESMADRDVWWSTYVAQQGDDASPIGRLIDWAWRTGRETHHSDEAVARAALTLAWVLSTPSRQLRDHATKGLVSLLHGRPHLMRGLLERFRGVNDMYIAERLYAVAYGCALRRLARTELEALARVVYTNVFADGNPPPQLLLRDYARGIIELAAASGLIENLNLSLARPPYQSEPPGEAPPEPELRASYYTPFQPGSDDVYYSLWSSLMGEGDFARYIVGTNNHSFDWTARPLFGPHEATRRARYDAFVEALPEKLKSRWRDIQLTEFMLQLASKDLPDAVAALLTALPPDAAVANLHEQMAGFRRELPETLHAEFDVVKDWGDESPTPHPFDLQHALRWLFQRVIDLGWTPARFNWFDRHLVEYGGRMSHRSERVGKKYQWIAWHEFTARVADSFEFRDDSWSGAAQVYHGPWQLYERDIDPSYLGRGGQEFDAASRPSWWQREKYSSSNDWRLIPDDREWIATAGDLPALKELVTPEDPDDATPWLWMRGDVTWKEPDPPDEEAYERPRRRINYWITAYVVRKAQRDELIRWARGRDLWSLRLHDAISTTQLFLGEYPWAPAFGTQHPAQIERPWTRLDGRLPVPVIQPAIRYYWESNGYDSSIENTINLSMPAPALVRSRESAGVDSWPHGRSQALFHNPSLAQPGPDALLARASAFRKWLECRKLDLVWLTTGEKLVIGGGHLGEKDEWSGRLEISTVGYFADDGWREWRTSFMHHSAGNRTRI